MDIQPVVFKLAESARYLGVSQVTVRRLVKKGRLKRLTFSRHVLITRAELDRFLAQAQA